MNEIFKKTIKNYDERINKFDFLKFAFFPFIYAGILTIS